MTIVIRTSEYHAERLSFGGGKIKYYFHSYNRNNNSNNDNQ